eukprot:Amastigsp_a681632_17.p2 type:complete len:119 gc:universal Amastigsp_a681632_17:648-292(-)
MADLGEARRRRRPVVAEHSVAERESISIGAWPGHNERHQREPFNNADRRQHVVDRNRVMRSPLIRNPVQGAHKLHGLRGHNTRRSRLCCEDPNKSQVLLAKGGYLAGAQRPAGVQCVR